MLPYSAMSKAQSAASLALAELRIVLTFVRDSAVVVGELLRAVIQLMKLSALVLLRRVSMLMANTRSSSSKVAVAAVPVPVAVAVAVAVAVPRKRYEPRVITSEIEQPPRCAVVITTPATTHAASKHKAMVSLAEIGIPVLEVKLCPETQQRELSKYTAISGERKLPQVFFEDAINGADREYVSLEEVKNLCSWTKDCGSATRTITSPTKQQKMRQTRMDVVFRGVSKLKADKAKALVALLEKEKEETAIRTKQIAQEKKMMAMEDKLAKAVARQQSHEAKKLRALEREKQSAKHRKCDEKTKEKKMKKKEKNLQKKKKKEEEEEKEEKKEATHTTPATVVVAVEPRDAMRICQ